MTHELSRNLFCSVPWHSMTRVGIHLHALGEDITSGVMNAQVWAFLLLRGEVFDVMTQALEVEGAAKLEKSLLTAVVIQEPREQPRLLTIPVGFESVDRRGNLDQLHNCGRRHRVDTPPLILGDRCDKWVLRLSRSGGITPPLELNLRAFPLRQAVPEPTRRTTVNERDECVYLGATVRF